MEKSRIYRDMSAENPASESKALAESDWKFESSRCYWSHTYLSAFVHLRIFFRDWVSLDLISSSPQVSEVRPSIFFFTLLSKNISSQALFWTSCVEYGAIWGHQPYRMCEIHIPWSPQIQIFQGGFIEPVPLSDLHSSVALFTNLSVSPVQQEGKSETRESTRIGVIEAMHPSWPMEM